MMIAKFWFLFVIASVQAVRIEAIVFIELTNNNILDHPVLPANCSSCPPGYGSVTPCTRDGETECTQCRSGYFSNNSSRDPCQPCSSCHDNEYEKERCSSTSDVVCKKCSICKLGFGVVKPCGRNSDTVCGLCPESDKEGYYLDHCQPCSKCGANVRQELFGGREPSSVSERSKRGIDYREKSQVSGDIEDLVIDRVGPDKSKKPDNESHYMQNSKALAPKPARKSGPQSPHVVIRCCPLKSFKGPLVVHIETDTSKESNTSLGGRLEISEVGENRPGNDSVDAGDLRTKPGTVTAEKKRGNPPYTTPEGSRDENKGKQGQPDWSSQTHNPTKPRKYRRRKKKPLPNDFPDPVFQSTAPTKNEPTEDTKKAGKTHKLDKRTNSGKDSVPTTASTSLENSTSAVRNIFVDDNNPKRATFIRPTTAGNREKDNKVNSVDDSEKETSDSNSSIHIGVTAAACMVVLVIVLLVLTKLYTSRKRSGSNICDHAPVHCVAPSECCDDISGASYGEECHHSPRAFDDVSHEAHSKSHFASDVNSLVVAADVHTAAQEAVNSCPSLVLTGEIKEHTFDSKGGKLCSKNSDIVIKVDHGTIPDNVRQTLFYRLIYDAKPLLQEFPEGPNTTLISPVFECGPSDATLEKPVEIVVPHCLCLDESKQVVITVFRCDVFQSESGPVWEKVPPASEKKHHSKAWFTVKKDTVNIKTKTFSFWCIFACGAGPKNRRAAVFASKPSPDSDKIYLRFYVYSDNDDSKRRIEAQEQERFPGSVPCTKEKPFKMYNDSKDLTVSLTDFEDGWLLDKTPNTQMLSYESGYHNGFRAKDSCDFVVKPTRSDVKPFCCLLKFQQDDHTEQSIYVDPGMMLTGHTQQNNNLSLKNKDGTSDENSEESRDLTCECILEGSSEETTANQAGAPQAGGTPQCFVVFKNELETSVAASRIATDEDCNSVCEDVGVNWKWLVRCLGVKEPVIKAIEEENNQVLERCYQGLLTWKKTKTSDATVGSLARALREIGEKDLAAQLLSKECPTTISAYQPDGPAVNSLSSKVTPV